MRLHSATFYFGYFITTQRKFGVRLLHRSCLRLFSWIVLWHLELYWVSYVDHIVVFLCIQAIKYFKKKCNNSNDMSRTQQKPPNRVEHSSMVRSFEHSKFINLSHIKIVLHKALRKLLVSFDPITIFSLLKILFRWS